MGRVEPVWQLEFRMKRQGRSFSGPTPAVSAPDAPDTQGLEADIIVHLKETNKFSVKSVVLTSVNVSGPVKGGIAAM